MWEALFGEIGRSGGSLDYLYYWRWANDHPYLFTIIKCSQPWLVAILLFVGSKILDLLFFNNRKRRG